MADILPITPSLLGMFMTCPVQYKAKYITKELKFVPNPKMEYGSEVHASLERAIKTEAALIPKAAYLQPLVDWLKQVMKRPGVEVLSEESLAITRDLRKTTWFGKGKNKPWLRGKADVLIIDHKRKLSLVIDLKTGKPKEDRIQADILSLCLSIATGYTRNQALWLHPLHNEVVSIAIPVRSLDSVGSTIAEVRAYEAACKADAFPPKPSGLCKQYCGVHSCPHNGNYSGG